MARKKSNQKLQDEFVKAILGDHLAEAKFWIGKNILPGDVFSYEALETWAIQNGFIKAE